jgi:hypothetical protein
MLRIAHHTMPVSVRSLSGQCPRRGFFSISERSWPQRGWPEAPKARAALEAIRPRDQREAVTYGSQRRRWLQNTELIPRPGLLPPTRPPEFRAQIGADSCATSRDTFFEKGVSPARGGQSGCVPNWCRDLINY